MNQKLFETISRITGHDCLESEMNEIIESYEKEKEVYEYKGKKYVIFQEIKTKIKGVWVETITYQVLYSNPDGMFWSRTKEEFNKLFKKVK